MNNPGQHPYRDRIVDEAADWYTQLQDSDAPETREAFTQWLSASAEHVREYLALTSLRKDLGALGSKQTVEELLQLAKDPGTENIISLDRGSIPFRRPVPNPGLQRKSKWPAALAASLVLAATAFFFLRTDPNSATYTTGRGEQKSFTLPDGSVVMLNTVSTLKLHFTEQYRDIRLESGEALFEVAKNPNRPFRVLTNDAIIQAVGTRFNVYHREADTTVSVVEGTVEVQAAPVKKDDLSQRPAAPIRLTRGQRAHVDLKSVTQSTSLQRRGSEGKGITVTPANTEADTAWRQRRLIFDARPLGSAVAEFNLYNDVQLNLTDPKLQALEISGNFNANDPQSFALFLKEARIATPEQTDPATIRLVVR